MCVEGQRNAEKGAACPPCSPRVDQCDAIENGYSTRVELTKTKTSVERPAGLLASLRALNVRVRYSSPLCATARGEAGYF